MEKPLVTIIIPVYNTAEWLPECLDSALSQDHGRLEVICVDDGSRDNSLQILESYAEKDSRVSVIAQENHGQGYARNRAMEKASGKYILFLDSDDMLEEGFISKLAARAEEDALDYLVFDFRQIFVNREEADRVFRSHRQDYPGLYTGLSLFNEMRKNGEEVGSACIAFYRTGFLRENGLTFPEGIYYEDELWIFRCYLKARRCGYLPVQGYIYRVRKDSSTTIRTTIKHIYDCYFIANQMMKLCAENTELLGPYPEFHSYAIVIKMVCAKRYYRNRDAIREQVRNDFDLMMLEDLDKYWGPGNPNSPQYRDGFAACEKMMTESASWKLGNLLIRPFSLIKRLLRKIRG